MITHTFTTKSNKVATVRYPTIADTKILADYINDLSQEDTYITFSGEKISYEEEEKFVRTTLSEIAIENRISLLCMIDDALVGFVTIERHAAARNRGRHVGVFGITIRKEHRNDGIGFELANIALKEAKRNVGGLRIVKLTVYEPNTVAYELYKKLGFKEFGRLPGGVLYKGVYYDEIEMCRDI